MAPILYTIRLITYSVTLLAVSFFAVFIGLVATICGQRLNTNYYVARTFYHTAGFIMGWDFEVEGEEHLWTLKAELGENEERGVTGRADDKGRSAVMLGNHQR
jgi:phosphatidylinositol glycan class A protein